MEKKGGVLLLAVLGGSTLAGPLLSQNPVVYRVRGIHRFDRLGSSLALLNDIDGDGVNDFVAGAAQRYIRPELEPWGYVQMISGKTGNVLRTWKGPSENREFGYALAALGDLDGDGKTDFAIAARPKTIFVASPVKEDWITRFEVKPGSRYFDVRVRLTSADLDGDGVLDLILGQPDHRLNESIELFVNNLGRVLAYSGKDWRILWDVLGTVEKGQLGTAVAAVGDVDGDGLPDVAAGEPMDGHFGNLDPVRGRVHIIRGRDGSTLRILDDDPGFYLGYSLANFGDLDGDGFSELAIASPGYWRARGRDQGWVGVYSTRTWKVLQQFTGLDGELTLEFHGDALGYELGLAGDVDLDGTPDYLIAAFRVADGLGPDYGRLDLRSGKTGALLASYQERQWQLGWIGAVSPLGDVDGDGRPEFLVGSPHIPTPNDDLREYQHGEVLLLRYEPDQPRFIRGDANGDGRVNIADARREPARHCPLHTGFGR